MLVTLGEDPAGGGAVSADWKKGSFFQELSPAGGAAGGGAGGRGGVGAAADRDGLLKNCVKLPSGDPAGCGAVAGAAAGGATGDAPDGRAALLKNCVKLPSPEAESEIPGDEKPLEREGPDDGGAGRGASSAPRAGGGVTPETKTRVNSLWPPSPVGGGPLTTCVATWGGSFGAGGAAGRCAIELNICVNSPCAEPAPEPRGKSDDEAGCGPLAG